MTNSPSEGQLNPNATLVGIGNCGGNVVQYVQKHCASPIQYIYMDTDEKDLMHRPRSSQPIHIERDPTANSSAVPWVNPAQACSQTVRSVLLKTHVLFIVAGLSGRTGTDATPVVARIAKEMDILTIGIAIMPFSFEGDLRIWRAKTMLAALRTTVGKLLVFHNEDLFALTDPDATQGAAFNYMNECILQAITQWLPEIRPSETRQATSEEHHAI